MPGKLPIFAVRRIGPLKGMQPYKPEQVAGMRGARVRNAHLHRSPDLLSSTASPPHGMVRVTARRCSQRVSARPSPRQSFFPATQNLLAEACMRLGIMSSRLPVSLKPTRVLRWAVACSNKERCCSTAVPVEVLAVACSYAHRAA